MGRAVGGPALQHHTSCYKRIRIGWLALNMDSDTEGRPHYFEYACKLSFFWSVKLYVSVLIVAYYACGVLDPPCACMRLLMWDGPGNKVRYAARHLALPNLAHVTLFLLKDGNCKRLLEQIVSRYGEHAFYVFLGARLAVSSGGGKRQASEGERVPRSLRLLSENAWIARRRRRRRRRACLIYCRPALNISHILIRIRGAAAP